MECPICLEEVAQNCIIGQVDPCAHYYHAQCIQQWASQSNLCPTCRKLFYRVDLRRQFLKRVISSFRVQDKLAENAAIDDIPAEYVVDDRTFMANEPNDAVVHTDGVCIICSSAQYSVQPMFACTACGGKFHRRCLGYQQEGYWFCPVCDYQMEVKGDFVRERRETVKEEGVEVRRPILGQVLLREIGLKAPKRNARSASGSKSAPKNAARPFTSSPFLEADEFDVLCVQETSSGRARVNNNGGSLLRRREKELQLLTSEEKHLWQMLESARQGIVESVQESKTDAEIPRKKRLRRKPESELISKSLTASAKLDSTEASSSKLATEKLHGCSRIALLIKQIQLRSTGSTIEIDLTNDSEEKEEVKIEGETEEHEEINGGKAETHVKKEAQKEESGQSKPLLSLEEKRLVQSHVRGILGPHYKTSKTPPIRSEEEYIAVNKSVSREIYRRISADPSLFSNHQKLHDLCTLCWTEYAKIK